MAKSKKAMGKEPVKASPPGCSGHGNNDPRDKLTRQAQSHYIKNHSAKALARDDANNQSEEEDGVDILTEDQESEDLEVQLVEEEGTLC